MLTPSARPMNLMKATIFATTICLAALSVSAQSSRVTDTILKKDGGRIRGVQITAMSRTTVTYKKGATESSIPSSAVASIQWDSPPDMCNEARGKEQSGDYDAAADLYVEAADKTDREPLKQSSLFLGARAALIAAGSDASKASAAGAALESYIDGNPDGYHSIAARILHARATRLQGDATAAEATLTALETTAIDENWGLAWDARAKFERAQTLLTLGRAQDARTAYQAVVSAVDAAKGSGDKDQELDRLRTQSLVGEGETYVTEGKSEDALRFFRRYAGPDAGGATVAVRAAALAGLGQALYLKAEESGDSSALREAQTALAEASIIESGTQETTAKALYYSGKILLALGPEKEKEAKSRARAYFDSVALHYPSTAWAALARSEAEK